MNATSAAAPMPPSAREHLDETRALLRILTQALAAVAVLALTFTAVNVTQLAVRHGVPWPTALLLDPMLALALATTLTVDARLTELGAAPPGWAVALRWFAGLAAWALNIWESVYPPSSGPVGVPRDADPTGIVLHSTPCALLILVSEAVAAYRRRIRHLLHVSPTWTPPVPQVPGVPEVRGAYPTYPTSTGAAEPSGYADASGYTASDAPAYPSPRAPKEREPAHAGTVPAPGSGRDPLYEAAVDLDRAARAATGRPITIRALRTDLRIGQTRARALRDRLEHDPDTIR